MNVLHLEDSGATAYYMERWLTEIGHAVLRAFNPAEAQSYWNRRSEVPVDCIVVDMQTPTDGLDATQVGEADSGILAGWIWLRDNVLLNSPEMRKRTIIYSDYVSELRSRVPQRQLEGIRVISKRCLRSSADQLIAAFKEIARLN
jgi:hypothetical protein